MKKVLIFSDLHAHNFREFSKIEDGFNSRLLDQEDVLERIYSDALDNEVDAVLFLGDLTHLKNNVDSQVIKIVSEKLYNISSDIPIFLIPGNHDYRLWANDPSLLEVFSSMSSNIHVLERGNDLLDGRQFFIFPYVRYTAGLNEEIKELKDTEHSIFLGHKDIIGSQYGKYIVDKGLDVDILKDKFYMSFIGHYHNPIKYAENVYSVGAPLQHNFSDMNQKRGWWIVDFDTENVKFTENELSPRFWNIDIKNGDEAIPGVHVNDFYRLNIYTDKLPEKFKKIRWKREVFIRGNTRKARSEISSTDSMEELIKKYVDIRASKDLNKDKLVEIGRKYL